MTSNLPTTITENSLVDQLKDKIKLELVNLIPEEDFQRMIKTVSDKFFNTQYDRYSGKDKCSDFTSVVLECLREDVRERTKVFLNSSDWKKHWDEEKKDKVVGDKIVELCKEHGSAMFLGFIEEMMQDVVSRMRPKY